MIMLVFYTNMVDKNPVKRRDREKEGLTHPRTMYNEKVYKSKST